MKKLTANELASELHTEPKVVRKFLRDVTPKEKQPGLGGRWEVSATKASMKKLMGQYEAWKQHHSTLVEKHLVNH